MIQAILSQLFSFSHCLINCSKKKMHRKCNWTKYPLLLYLSLDFKAFFSSCSLRSISLLMFEAKFSEAASKAFMYLWQNKEIKHRKWHMCRWINEAKELSRMNFSLTSSSPPMHCLIFCRRTRASMPSWTAGFHSQSDTSGLRPCVPEAEFGSVWVCSHTRGRSSQLRW